MSVAIIGGGLSGLHAAHLLQQQGIDDWVLLEARPRLGGRIASLTPSGKPEAGRIDRFDLGPAWFWPELQPALDHLIEDLGIARFAQHEDGDMLLERSPAEPPIRVRGHFSSPASMRLVGGMGALVDALHHRLDAGRVITGQTVRQLRLDGSDVAITGEGAQGTDRVWRVDHVLLAMPPRLAAQTLAFTPDLPTGHAEAWRATPTWMAPHAKYIAVYDKPFWRDVGLSGSARSARGPMVEIHDACMPGGSAALFGFLGVPPQVRRDATDDQLRAACRAQLARLFGPEATTPLADAVKDWAADPCTATPLDLSDARHPTGDLPSSVASGPWRGRLTCVGSEWSPRYPGYMAGAIEAATLGVEQMLSAERLGGLPASHGAAP